MRPIPPAAIGYLVDYTRSPDATNSPAIDPIFQTTSITNEAGQVDYPFFWSSTTFLTGRVAPAGAACISFGRALGEMFGKVMDVHDAGAQRPEPKAGRASIGGGFTQGGARRTRNFVRLVRGGTADKVISKPRRSVVSYPEKIRVLTPNPTKPVLLSPMSRRGMMQRGGGGRIGGGSGGVSGLGGQGGGNHFISHFDINGDGRVSRSEFTGPSSHFYHLDRNGDGYITGDEAPQGAPPGGMGASQGDLAVLRDSRDL